MLSRWIMVLTFLASIHFTVLQIRSENLPIVLFGLALLIVVLCITALVVIMQYSERNV